MYWGKSLTIGWGTIFLFSLIGLVSNYLGVKGYIHFMLKQTAKIQQLMQKQNAGISKENPKD